MVELFGCYGVRVWPTVVAASVKEAAAAAANLGYPVALKATAEHLRHRPDLSSVRLGLGSEAELRAAYATMWDFLGAAEEVPHGGVRRPQLGLRAEPEPSATQVRAMPQVLRGRLEGHRIAQVGGGGGGLLHRGRHHRRPHPDPVATEQLDHPRRTQPPTLRRRRQLRLDDLPGSILVDAVELRDDAGRPGAPLGVLGRLGQGVDGRLERAERRHALGAPGRVVAPHLLRQADHGQKRRRDRLGGLGDDVGEHPGALLAGGGQRRDEDRDDRVDPGVDAVITVFIPPLTTPGEEVARVLADVVAEATKPVASTFLAMVGLPEEMRRYDAARGAQGVPSFRSPEAAVYALAKAAEYAEWRTRPPGVVPELDGIDEDRAREIVEAELAAAPQGRWLSPARMVELFGCYGVRVWPTVVAASVEEAAT